jgi:hypothetical protein
MIGSTKDSVTLVKEKNRDVITTHCFLHREVVTKSIGNNLKQFLDTAVSMVNLKKQRLLKSHISAMLCESMQKIT